MATCIEKPDNPRRGILHCGERSHLDPAATGLTAVSAVDHLKVNCSTITRSNWTTHVSSVSRPRTRFELTKESVYRIHMYIRPISRSKDSSSPPRGSFSFNLVFPLTVSDASEAEGERLPVVQQNRLIGGVDRAELDVREGDRSIRTLGLHVLRVARIPRASTAGNARLRRILIKGIIRVQPKHMRGMVIPNGHNKHDSLLEALGDTLQPTELFVVVIIAKSRLALGTEGISDRVASCDARDIDLRVLDNLPVLLVDAADLFQVTSIGVALGDELGDDGELGIGIDELAGAEEGFIAETEGVEVAAVFVADAIVALTFITAIGAFAAFLRVHRAGVGGVGGGDGVGLPDIHLLAAGAVAATTGVRVGVGLVPIEHVRLELSVSLDGPGFRIQLTSPLMNLMSCGH